MLRDVHWTLRQVKAHLGRCRHATCFLDLSAFFLRRTHLTKTSALITPVASASVANDGNSFNLCLSTQLGKWHIGRRGGAAAVGGRRTPVAGVGDRESLTWLLDESNTNTVLVRPKMLNSGCGTFPAVTRAVTIVGVAVAIVHPSDRQNDRKGPLELVAAMPNLFPPRPTSRRGNYCKDLWRVLVVGPSGQDRGRLSDDGLARRVGCSHGTWGNPRQPRLAAPSQSTAAHEEPPSRCWQQPLVHAFTPLLAAVCVVDGFWAFGSGGPAVGFPLRVALFFCGCTHLSAC